MAWRTMAFVALAFFAMVPGTGAAEVVEFRSGLYLEIASHELSGGFVRLNVGHDSFLIVPVDGLEKIRQNGVVVYPRIAPGDQAERLQPVALAGRRSRQVAPEVVDLRGI